MTAYYKDSTSNDSNFLNSLLTAKKGNDVTVTLTGSTAIWIYNLLIDQQNLSHDC